MKFFFATGKNLKNYKTLFAFFLAHCRSREEVSVLLIELCMRLSVDIRVWLIGSLFLLWMFDFSICFSFFLHFSSTWSLFSLQFHWTNMCNRYPMYTNKKPPSHLIRTLTAHSSPPWKISQWENKKMQRKRNFHIFAESLFINSHMWYDIFVSPTHMLYPPLCCNMEK